MGVDSPRTIDPPVGADEPEWLRGERGHYGQWIYRNVALNVWLKPAKRTRVSPSRAATWRVR